MNKLEIASGVEGCVIAGNTFQGATMPKILKFGAITENAEQLHFQDFVIDAEGSNESDAVIALKAVIARLQEELDDIEKEPK